MLWFVTLNIGEHDFQIKQSSFGDISDVSRNYNKRLCQVIGNFNKTFLFYFFMLHKIN